MEVMARMTDAATSTSESATQDDPISARVAARLRDLAAMGGQPGSGITRLAYTSLERDAHALFRRWVEAEGKRVETDAVGNTIAVFKEGEPYFLIGSHLDTVAQGGAYDGAAGVVGALEAADLVSPTLKHGLRVVVFAAEEGARFGRPNLGSAAAAGLLNTDDLTRLRDADGISVYEAATLLGFSPLSLDPWIDKRIACFFEIHIEQGRTLELSGARIGLVDAIAGSIRMRLDITGRPDHSGATPMEIRADALVAASQFVLAAEEIARGYRSTVATVGRMEVWPNSLTTVPGKVTLWIDIRDADADQQRHTARILLERAEAIGEARNVAVTAEVVTNQTPVVLAAWPRAIVRDECEARHLVYRVMPSGAGHDAAIVARRAPATMIFIPCVNGVSHAPDESASSDDIALASELLSAAIERADRFLD